MFLEVEKVTAGYGKLMVFRDLSFSLDMGKTLAVIGPNGAGKTTLLWSLSGLIKPKSGHVRLEAKEVTGLDPFHLVKLGMGHVLEGMHVFSTQTVEDNLLLGAYGRKNSQHHLQSVYKYFPVLAAKRNQIAGSLSGGEKQMLAIGRALMRKLKLLLLDEPSAGLAPLIVERLFEILRDLRHEYELTILLVEQNAEVALEFADRGMVLAHGEVMLEGEASQLADNDQVKKIYLGENDLQ